MDRETGIIYSKLIGVTKMTNEEYLTVKENPTPRENLTGQIIEAEVVRVQDGDTLYIKDDGSNFFDSVQKEDDGTISIRFSGVGTPEGTSYWDMKDDNGDYLPYKNYKFTGDFIEKQPNARDAFDFVYNYAINENTKDLVKIRLDVRTYEDGKVKVGLFGRPVAIIYVQNKDGEWINLNRTLLVNNLANPYYVDDMNLSDDEKSLWQMESLLYAFNHMSENPETYRDDRDGILGLFDPNKDVRIGDTVLPIPPESISITTVNDVKPSQVIRNGTTMLSSTGHNIKQIQMEFYFRDEKKEKYIDGEKSIGDEINGFPVSSNENIVTNPDEVFEGKSPKTFSPTYYVNGLRPLLAQFKLTPFLPIENDYLNNKHDISAVTLQNITVSSVPEFPGLLKATLVVLEFNYQVYIDTLQPFKTIFDWKLFRFYYQRLIDGTGFNHKGTKLKEFKKDNHFSFDIATLWSLQKRENAKKALSNVIRDYQIDVTKGDSLFEKITHDMQLFIDGKNQYNKLQEIKTKHDSIEEMANIYFAYCGEEEQNYFNKEIYKPYSLEAYTRITNISPGHYTGRGNISNPISFAEKVNFGTVGYYEISLRHQYNIFLLKKLLENTADITDYELKTLEKISSAIDKDDYREQEGLLISVNTFNELYDSIVNLGEDIDNQRTEAITESKDGLNAYETKRYEFKDLILQNVAVSMSNSVNTLKINMQPKPAHQYLGGKEINISVDFVTNNREVIQRFSTLLNHVKTMELRYTDIIERPLMNFNNNIVDMFNLDGIHLKTMTTNTVPGMPGLFQISLTMIGYKKGPDDSESLSKLYNTEYKEDKDMGEDVITDYFKIKERMNEVCLYPDLELPRFCDLPLPKDGQTMEDVPYDKNDKSYVDPDFYAMGINKLMIEDVIDAVFTEDNYKIIGKGFDGENIVAEVNNDGSIKKIDSNEAEPELKEDDILDYSVLSRMDDKNSINQQLKYDLDKSKVRYDRSVELTTIGSRVPSYKMTFYGFEKRYRFELEDKLELNLLKGVIWSNWDSEFVNFNGYQPRVYFGGKPISDENTTSILKLPKEIFSNEKNEVVEKAAYNPRLAINKLIYESARIANILMDNTPSLKLLSKEEIGDKARETIDEFHDYHSSIAAHILDNRVREQYYSMIYRFISYLLIYGLTIDDIKNETPAYQAVVNKYIPVFHKIDFKIGFEATREVIRFEEMLNDLPWMAELIASDMEEIDALILTNEVPEYFLQQRSTKERFRDSFHDMLEYDRRGRLVRAFPAYYMMLVDEGRKFMWWKLQDIFYEYSGIQSIDVVRDKKNVADTCMITLSNSKGNLSNATGAYKKRSYNMGIAETLWSLTPFPEIEWERKKREANLDSVELSTGARIHLRIGYGSNPVKLPTVFNGTITELQLGDIVSFVAQSDGIELNKLIPASPNDFTEYEWIGDIQEPKEIITDLLGNRGNLWAVLINKASGKLLYNDNAFGVQHFGAIDRPSWWDKSESILRRHPYDSEVTKNSETQSYEDDKPRGFEVAQNINSSTYEHNRFALSLYGKTVWDVLQSCAMVAPNYIAAVHPFGFRNTIFYGHPNFDFAYDYKAPFDKNYGAYGRYERDSDGKIPVSKISESIKPYRQLHFYNSFYDIISNNIRTSDRDMLTAVKPVMSKGDGSPVEKKTLYLDTDIFPQYQKLASIETGIKTPDWIRSITTALTLQEKDEEISARRYGMAALKQFVQNMYDGEILVLGDPTVKPYDYSYLADVKNRLSGMFEVSTVVHTINKQTGFITSITPAPLASVNEGLKDDVDFWKWSKSNFSKIYTSSVITRLSVYGLFNFLKNFFSGLVTDGALFGNNPVAALLAINADEVAEVARKFNATTPIGWLGNKGLERLKKIITKTDDFMIKLAKFLDNSQGKKMILDGLSDRAQTVSKGVLSTRNAFAKIAQFYKQSGSMVDDLPGLFKDIKTFNEYRKAFGTVEVIKDTRAFKSLLGYGIKYGDDILGVLSGPWGILIEMGIEWVLTRKLSAFINNTRESREVITLMLLDKAGSEFSSGIKGHAGCVIGDDPSSIDRFWNHPVLNMIVGESSLIKQKEQLRDEMQAYNEGAQLASDLMNSGSNMRFAMAMLNVRTVEELKSVFTDEFGSYINKIVFEDENSDIETEDEIIEDGLQEYQGERLKEEMVEILTSLESEIGNFKITPTGEHISFTDFRDGKAITILTQNLVTIETIIKALSANNIKTIHVTDKGVSFSLSNKKEMKSHIDDGHIKDIMTSLNDMTL